MTEQAKVPEIRFAGFTDPWEQRKLGDVTDSFSGGTPDGSHASYYGGSIPFIRSAEINSDKTELFLTEKGLDNSSAKIVERGTVLYALYGATSGEVGIAAIKGAINQAILALSLIRGMILFSLQAGCVAKKPELLIHIFKEVKVICRVYRKRIVFCIASAERAAGYRLILLPP